MSTIELKWTDRVIGGAQTPRRFLDFVVDGNSLYPMFGDRITPFGWGTKDSERKAINRFLLEEDADFPNNRRSIYVCAECGDLGCGAVSAVIEEKGNQIIWHDFGYENNYEDDVDLDNYRDIGPFAFDRDDYRHTIESKLQFTNEQ
jgi:hypothetical protein